MIDLAGFRSETIARQRIAEYLGGARFALLWKNTPILRTLAERRKFAQEQPSLDTAVAVFGAVLREQGIPPWMRLSRDGIGHIKASGRGIKPEHLRLVQAAVDGEQTYQQRDNQWISYARDEKRQWWAVAWKLTGDGRRAYLTTFHRADDRHIERDRRRGGEDGEG